MNILAIVSVLVLLTPAFLNLLPIKGVIENHEQWESSLSGKQTNSQSVTTFSKNFANLTGHGGPVWAAAFSPDDSILASGSEDGSVRLWNVSNGDILHLLQGHYFHVYSLDFSSDGSILASGGIDDRKINFWNISTGTLLQTWFNTSSEPLLDIEFSPVDNSLLAFSRNDSIVLRNVTDGKVVQTFQGHTGIIESLTFSPNGSLLASGSDDSSIKVWNVSTGVELRNFTDYTETVRSVAFSPDNTLLASGGFDTTMKIWNLTSGTLFQTLPASTHPILSIAFSPKDPTILASSGTKNLGWPEPMHDPTIKIWNLTSGEVLETLQGHTNGVFDLAFSHDGTILASCSIDRTIKLWGDYPSIIIEPPVDYWPTSTPEEQGMDSAELDQINLFGFHSLVALRHGTIVYEEYYSGTAYVHTRESKHVLWSVTKSFVSALIGIAIEKGFISNTSQKVLDFFPEYTFLNVDSRKEAMTLEHLLTMTTGLRGVGDFFVSNDSIQYILDKPMRNEPGTVYQYNNGASHLLSAIIQKTTGQSTFEFALTNLFTPLGIEKDDIIWMTDPLGIAYGFAGLYLTPRNMAKLGQLYLHNGSWNGQQVVPADWVAISTKNHVAGLPIIPPVVPLGYGYQWWIYEGFHNEGYYAQGYDGQFIFVVPKQDLVVVGTAGGFWIEPYSLVNKFIDTIIIETTTETTTTTTTTTTSVPGWTSLPILMSILIILLINRKLKRIK